MGVEPDPSPETGVLAARRQRHLDLLCWFWCRRETRPGAGPIWARFYDPQSGKPVFGDRDRSIHDDVNEISLERRNGYSWWGSAGTGVATAHAAWATRR